MLLMRRAMKLFLLHLKNCVFINFDMFSLKTTNVPEKPLQESFSVFFTQHSCFAHAKLLFVIKMCTI